MKKVLDNRGSEYFNNKDYFLIHTNLNRFFVTEAEFFNGSWYSLESLKYKMISTQAINCNELYGKEVEYVSTGIKGTLTKALSPNSFGIVWHQGQGEKFRKYGFPNFWTDPQYLKIL